MSERKHITSETSNVPGVPTGTPSSTLPPSKKEFHTDVYLSGCHPNLDERPLHEGGLPTTAPVVEIETRYHRPIPGRTQHKEEVIEKRQVFVEKIEKEPHHTRIVQTEERPIGGYSATGTAHSGVLHDIPIQTTQASLERQPGEHPLLVTEPQQTKIYTQEQPETIGVHAPISESTQTTEHMHHVPHLHTSTYGTVPTVGTGTTEPTEPFIPKRHARGAERPVETGATGTTEVPTNTSTTGKPIVHVHKYEEVDPASHKIYSHTHISEHYTPQQAAQLKSDIQTYEKEYLPTETSFQLTKCPRCNLENCVCVSEKGGTHAKGTGASKPKHSDVYHERAFGEKTDPHKLIIKEGKEGEILVEGKQPGILKPNLPKIHSHERPLHHDVVISSKYPTNQTEGLDQMKNKMHEKTSEPAMGKKDEPRTENYSKKERVAMAQKGAQHMKDVNRPYQEIAENPKELYGPPQKEDPFSSAVKNERDPKIQKPAGNFMGSISQGAEELSKKVLGDEKASAGRGEKYSGLGSENIPPSQQFTSEKKVPSSSAVPIYIATTNISSTTQPSKVSNVPMTFESHPQSFTEPTEFVELGLEGDARIQIKKRADFKYAVPMGDTQELIRQEIRSTPFEVFEGIGCNTEPDEIEEQPSIVQSIEQGYEQMGKGFSPEISRGMQEGKRDKKSLGQQIREAFTRDTSKHPVYKTYRFPEGFMELTQEQLREKMLPPEGVSLSELSTNKPYEAKGMRPPNITSMADVPQPKQKESSGIGQKVKNLGKSIKQGLGNIAEGMKNIGLETQEGLESSNIAPSTGPVESAHGAETFEAKARKPAYAGKEDSICENIKTKADGYQRSSETYYRRESDFTQAGTGVRAVSESTQAEGQITAGQNSYKYDGMESLQNTVPSNENEKSESGVGILSNLRNLYKKEKADSGKVEKYSTQPDQSQHVESECKNTSENLKGIASDVKEDVFARAKQGHEFTQEYIDQLKRQASSKGESAMHTLSSMKDRANDTKDEAQTTAQQMGAEAMQKATDMKESAKEVMSSGIQKAKDSDEPLTPSASSEVSSTAQKTSELGQQALSTADKSETVKQGTEYLTEKKHEARGACKLNGPGSDIGNEATEIGKEASNVAAPIETSTDTSILGYAFRAIESAISFKNRLVVNYTTEQQQELFERMETHERVAEVSSTQIQSAKKKSDMISEVIQLGRSEIYESVAEKGLEFKHPELSYNKSLIDQAKEVIDDVKEYFEVEAAIMLGGPESLKNLHFKSEAENASGFSTFSNLTYAKSTEKAQAGKGSEGIFKKNGNEGCKSLIAQAKDVIQGVKEYFEIEASLITGGPDSLKNKSFKSESESAKIGYESGSAGFRNSLKDRYKEKADAGKSETSKKLGSTFEKPKQKTEHTHEYLKKKEAVKESSQSTGPQIKQGVKLDQPKVERFRDIAPPPEDIKRGPHLPEELTAHEVGKTTNPKSTTTKGSWTLPGPPVVKSPLKQSQKHKPPTKEDFSGTGIHALESNPDKGEKILQHNSKKASKIGSNKSMKPMKKLKNRSKSKEKEKASSGKPDLPTAEGLESLPNLRVIREREQGFGKHSIKHESPSKKKAQKHKPPTREDFSGTGIHVLESNPDKGEKILQHNSKKASKIGSNKPMKPMKKLKNPHYTKESERAHAGRGENISDKLSQEELHNLPQQIKQTGKDYQQAAMKKGTELKEATQERSQQASEAAMEKGASAKESTKESTAQATEYEKSWGDTIIETAQEIGHVALEELQVIADTAVTVVRKASDSLSEVKDKILGSTEATSEQTHGKGTELKENLQAKMGQTCEDIGGKASELKEGMESSEERSRELAEKGTELTKEAVEHGAIDMSDRVEDSSHRQNVEQERLLHHGDIKSQTEKTEEKIGQKLHENVEGMKESKASGLKSMLNLDMNQEKAESGNALSKGPIMNSNKQANDVHRDEKIHTSF